MIPQLIAWLKGIEDDNYHLDMFSKFDISKFTDPTLQKFNLLMEKWASAFEGPLRITRFAIFSRLRDLESLIGY